MALGYNGCVDPNPKVRKIPVTSLNPNPKAQNSPKALYSMVFGPKSLNLKYESLEP